MGDRPTAAALIVVSGLAASACSGPAATERHARQSAQDNAIAHVVIQHPPRHAEPRRTPRPRRRTASPPKGQKAAPRLRPPAPKIITAKRPLQCVPYARQSSNIAIRGDAWTWWRTASGRYRRGARPEVGSVLVFKRKRRGRGHLAVVKRIVSEREIIVDHANWLNRGRIHLGTPVRDESAANDWSKVRVWYTPGRVWGKSVYRAYGFIYPRTQTAGR